MLFDLIAVGGVASFARQVASVRSDLLHPLLMRGAVLTVLTSCVADLALGFREGHCASGSLKGAGANEEAECREECFFHDCLSVG